MLSRTRSSMVTGTWRRRRKRCPFRKKETMKNSRLFHTLPCVGLLVALACVSGPAPRAAEPVNPNTQEGRSGVAQVLIALLEKADNTKISADDYASTSLGDIVKFGTPA